MVTDYLSKEDVRAAIHSFFFKKIEATPTVVDEDGEHYIIENVEPLLEMNKELSAEIEKLSTKIVFCRQCKHRKFIDWGMGDCLHPHGVKVFFASPFCRKVQSIFVGDCNYIL